MKDVITSLVELGRRLMSFGDDAPTQLVVARACADNGWFTPTDIRRAVRTVARDMLQRDRLEAWLARYRPVTALPPVSRRVLVVMAGNIPLVGFFDLLCVVASGHHCVIKPSSKDRVLMEYVVDLLHQIDAEIPVGFYDAEMPVDAVLATGGDRANRYFRTQYAAIPALLRGNRHSVAVLSGQENDTQLAGLSDDVWAYSGLGCRSVSLIFLPENRELHLSAPQDINPKYRNNYLQQKALLAMNGRPFLDLGCAVATEERGFPEALSRICYTHYQTPEEVETWLAEHDDELQCVVSECIDHPSRVDFGQAQSPSLTDFPDRRDVMAFLGRLK